MKKHITGTLVVCLVALAMGCTRCTECRIVDSRGNVEDVQRQCGTNQELENFKDDCTATYSPLGRECQCTTS